MNGIRILAIVLIVVGALGLAYGSFSYSKNEKVVDIGSLELSAKKTETVNIPMWAGIGTLILGGVMLTMGGKKD